MKRLVGNSFPPYWYPDSIGENRMSLSGSFKTRGTFPRGLWVSTKTISSCLEPEWTTWNLKLGQLYHWQQVYTCKTIGEGEVRGWDRPPNPSQARQGFTHWVCGSLCFVLVQCLLFRAKFFLYKCRNWIFTTYFLKTACTMLCSAFKLYHLP